MNKFEKYFTAADRIGDLLKKISEMDATNYELQAKNHELQASNNEMESSSRETNAQIASFTSTIIRMKTNLAEKGRSFQIFLSMI